MSIPENAEYYDWNGFVVYAEKQGVDATGDKDDWEAWWLFWRQGYISAMN